MEPDLYRLRVRLESFRARERQDGRRETREPLASDALDRHHAHVLFRWIG